MCRILGFEDLASITQDAETVSRNNDLPCLQLRVDGGRQPWLNRASQTFVRSAALVIAPLQLENNLMHDQSQKKIKKRIAPVNNLTQIRIRKYYISTQTSACANDDADATKSF